MIFAIHLRRLPQSGAISDLALNSEMMSTMDLLLKITITIAMMTIMMILLTRDLVAGNGCGAWEPLMSAIDLFAQVGGRAPLLLARC